MSQIDRYDLTIAKQELEKRIKNLDDDLINHQIYTDDNFKNIYNEITLLKSLHLKNQKIIVSGIIWLLITVLIIKYI